MSFKATLKKSGLATYHNCKKQFIISSETIQAHQLNCNYGYRCVSTESAINSSLISEACAPALKSEYTMILPLDYTSLDDDLRFLDNAVMAANVGSFCDQAARGYLCNYIFIPCDSNTSEPIGICEEDCRHFFFERNSCNNVFSFLFGLSSESGVTVPRQCNDTLLLLEMTGVNVTRSTECFRFRGILIQCL